MPQSPRLIVSIVVIVKPLADAFSRLVALYAVPVQVSYVEKVQDSSDSTEKDGS